MSRSIDLNADLGEGFGRWRLGEDEALLDVVTSANIACGFHAGDPTIMRRVCEQAVTRGVSIGAQVGYRDLAGFGRRRIEMDRGDLAADVLYQLGALQAFATAAGGRVGYVKPHGALYNTAVADEDQAAAIIDAIVAFDHMLPVLTLAGSALARLARARGVRPVSEAFADRGYQPDGTLTPRSEPGAILTDPAQISERAVAMASTGRVRACDGTEIAIEAESVCVHGDTPGALDSARAVRVALTEAGVALGPF